MLTACLHNEYNYQKKIESWEGRTESDLIARWGEPHQILKSTASNQIKIFEYVAIKMYNAENNVNYSEEEAKSLDIIDGEGYIKKQYETANQAYHFERCATWFQINKKGLITQTRFKGKLCKSMPFIKP